MKRSTTCLMLLLPLLAIGQQKITMEVFGSPNFTWPTDGISNGKMGYEVGTTATMLSKNEQFQWLCGIVLTNTGTKFTNNEVDATEPFFATLPNGESIKSLTRRRTRLSMGMPLGLRTFLSKGRSGIFLQPSLGPMLIVANREEEVYEYWGLPDYRLVYSGVESKYQLKAVAGVGIGALIEASAHVNISVMPYFSATFLNFGSLIPASEARARTTAGLRVSLSLK